jgi:ribosomal protein S11
MTTMIAFTDATGKGGIIRVQGGKGLKEAKLAATGGT